MRWIKWKSVWAEVHQPAGQLSVSLSLWLPSLWQVGESFFGHQYNPPYKPSGGPLIIHLQIWSFESTIRYRASNFRWGTAEFCKLHSTTFFFCDRSQCVDIDECQGPSPPCSHECLNTPGAYKCACPKGFRLSDGRTCASKCMSVLVVFV